MSMSRLWIRISNCSRDFLSVCGDRKTQYFLICVGSSTGPTRTAPVRFTTSTILTKESSSILWSYDLNRIRIFGAVVVLVACAVVMLRDHVRDDAGAHRVPAFADGKAH